MRRDLIFFVNGVPEWMLVHGTNYFCAPVTSEIVAEVKAKLGALVDHWVRRAGRQLHAFGFRNEFADEAEAIRDAHEKLSALMDGYSFITEEVAPEIWPMVQVREGDQPNATIKFFEARGWMRRKSADGVAEKAWDARNMQILGRFLPFFGIVCSEGASVRTELAEQISLSAKMFRHGSMAQVYGVDYLCKFSALEGLVCGPSRHSHGELLRRRLCRLFRHRMGIEEEVRTLWRMRCEASHQGKAFADLLSVLVNRVEALIVGAAVFALDNLKVAATVDELWDKHVSNYILPGEAIQERPPKICRFPFTSLVVDRKLEWTNVGPLVDSILAAREFR
jgi:hypothetical protein